MREGLKDLAGFEDSNRKCPVCTKAIEVDDEIVRIQQGSSETIVKKTCYDAMKKYNEKNGQDLGFPHF